MKPLGACGRADLVRALRQGDPAMAQIAAELLGFDAVPVTTVKSYGPVWKSEIKFIDTEEEITLDSTTKSLKLKNLRTEEKISSPPSRYGEASLVKELEKLEIGRPSTYAALITKIKDRK